MIRDRWARGYRLSDGLQFVLFASESNPNVFHRTHINGLGCSCIAATKSRNGRCWHQLAARTDTELAQNAEPQYDYSDEFGLVDIA